MDPKLRFVHFASTDGFQLPGLLLEPELGTKKVTIFLHGNGSGGVFYSPEKINTLASKLASKGVAFFAFNNRGANYMVRLKRDIEGKEEKIMYGTSYELIKECILDIDGAISYLRSIGFREFYLIGSSTGANKIVVYHYYRRDNPVSKYVLLSGGDDTGLYYQEMGKEKFMAALERAKGEVKKGNGRKMIPKYLTSYPFSWQALYDTIDPDGDYNIFPFNDSMNHLRLSTKRLFREYKTIDKPTLVIYGERDEYCYGDVKRCVEILKEECPDKSKFTFKIIHGADHGFTGYDKELAQIIGNWL